MALSLVRPREGFFVCDVETIAMTAATQASIEVERPSVFCPARAMQNGSGFGARQVSIFVFELAVDEYILDSF